MWFLIIVDDGGDDDDDDDDGDAGGSDIVGKTKVLDSFETIGLCCDDNLQSVIPMNLGWYDCGCGWEFLFDNYLGKILIHVVLNPVILPYVIAQMNSYF